MRLGVLAAFCLLAACGGEAARGLDAHDAEEAIAALGVAGVPATHRATTDRGEVIEVPAGEEAFAAAVLRAEGLPREPKRGFAALAAGASLVATPAEDDARWLAALGGEIAAHLLHLDGVADASVVTTRPPVDPLAPAVERTRPTASVLLVLKASAAPSWTATDVQRLVAAASGARPEDVTVVLARAPAPPAGLPLLSTIGPITVARSSRDAVYGIVVAVAALLLGLGVLLLIMERRRMRAKAKTKAEKPGAT